MRRNGLVIYRAFISGKTEQSILPQPFLHYGPGAFWLCLFYSSRPPVGWYTCVANTAEGDIQKTTCECLFPKISLFDLHQASSFLPFQLQSVTSHLFGNGLLITYCLMLWILSGFLQDTSSSASRTWTRQGCLHPSSSRCRCSELCQNCMISVRAIRLGWWTVWLWAHGVQTLVKPGSGPWQASALSRAAIWKVGPGVLTAPASQASGFFVSF